MKNVKIKKDGKKLIIEVDLTKSFGDTKTGKSELIASTVGNQPIEGGDGLFIGLNIYKRKER